MPDLFIDGIAIGGGSTIAVSAIQIGAGSKNIPIGRKLQLEVNFTPSTYIIIQAKATNVGVVWVAGLTIDIGRGISLSASSQPLRIDIDNLQDIWIAGTFNDGVTYIWGSTVPLIVSTSDKAIRDQQGEALLDEQDVDEIEAE